MTDLVRLFVDGVEHKVPKGANLVDAAKLIGNDIPVFCYHPKLSPVGMCRMCLVDLGNAQIVKETGEFQKDDKGELAIRWFPKLQTACTTFVTDGMAIRTNTQQVTEARDDIIEFLLTSHPLDCPICDKGGECPLQNLTMRHGAGTSRFTYEEKMRLDKHYPLGDLIFLDRERCIQCARCTRFQEELVGDAVLGFHERGRRLQIVTTSTPEFDTYFSGNTTDICPVGALTTADFRFGARPWELTEVPSICPHCPVGCNISATTRLDRDAGGKTIVKRIMPRQNEEVNEIWICDKGRFGHHHSRSNDRLTQPMLRKDGTLVPATWDQAYAAIAQQINMSEASVAAIAGPMLSNEDLWELRRLVNATGGTQLGVWPYHMTGADLTAQVGVGTGTNLKDLGKGTTIVVVASDIEEEAPVWYLRIKAARDRGARVISVNPRQTELDRWVRKADRHIYALGEAVAAVNALDLGDAQNVIILVGGEGLDRANHGAVMKAAAQKLVATGHYGKPNNGLLAVWAGANTQGAFDLGYTSEATEAILSSRPKVLFLADADPVGEDALNTNLLSSGFTVAIEMFMTPTAAAADVVLPRQAFAERDGSFTNGERRVQRFYTAQQPINGTLPDWRIFATLLRTLNGTRIKLSASAVMQEITQNVPSYANATYPKLAEVKPQFPDVGGVDLYYGGTAYNNQGGLGVQWSTSSEQGFAPSIDAVALNPQPLPPRQAGELLIVPVKELYDRQPEFAASLHLMATHIDAPYIALNEQEAASRSLTNGEAVAVNYAGTTAQVSVRIDNTVPAGTALIGRHLSAQPTPPVPVVGTVRKVEVLANA
jgi:NADH-quinone oxidoreductase subunit G